MRLNVSLTYVGCAPGQVERDALGRGDVVSTIVELVSPPEDVWLEFEG